ncbi:MAG: IS630 family transposase [Coleofasciculus sp. A1-SPW-01]|uniref:IS630 family transposase n=1 Tax=Coleofasciculus sp. A1-SPW-01 TaxID=3070819 RepID=UPI0032F3F67E
MFIDEMGIQLSLCRTHARSPKGQRAYGSKPYSRGKNVSVIGAIALKGFLGCMTLEGTTNGDAFQVFVEKVLLNCLWPGAVVVMDNLSAHKVASIESIIEKAGAKVIYLSPYSPDFNPIENCWSKLKQYLRKAAARCRDIVEQALVNAIDLVTPTDIRNWLAHGCYCTTPC